MRYSNKMLVVATLLSAVVWPAVGFSQGETPPLKETPEAEAFRLVEYPIAILPFRERGKEVAQMGGQVADLLFAKLVVDPSLYLVDREDLDKTVAEAKLNLSGIVNPQEAIAIGQLTGARLLVTGSVFQIDTTVYVVAKIIGTETSRVVGASVKSGPGDGLDALANRLGEEVIRSIKQKSDSLVAKHVEKADRIATLKENLSNTERPSVLISVDERHIGRMTIDPAAETELTLFCKETGFVVLDPDQGSSQQAKYLIQGEGVSEFATRHGDLISVKARLEVKAIDRVSGKVVAIDRQTRVAVDLGEEIAGKKALQDAAADIAERLLPKLLKNSEE